MTRTIANKDTSGGTESKFSFVIRAQVWPASTAKNSKRLIIRSSVEKTLNWSIMIYHFTGKKIDKESGCKKGFIPEF
jgi:hypothetical protein